MRAGRPGSRSTGNVTTVAAGQAEGGPRLFGNRLWRLALTGCGPRSILVMLGRKPTWSVRVSTGLGEFGFGSVPAHVRHSGAPFGVPFLLAADGRFGRRRPATDGLPERARREGGKAKGPGLVTGLSCREVH